MRATPLQRKQQQDDRAPTPSKAAIQRRLQSPSASVGRPVQNPLAQEEEHPLKKFFGGH